MPLGFTRSLGDDKFKVYCYWDSFPRITGSRYKFIEANPDRKALFFQIGVDFPVGDVYVGGPSGPLGILRPPIDPFTPIHTHFFCHRDTPEFSEAEFWYQSGINPGDFSVIELICQCPYKSLMFECCSESMRYTSRSFTVTATATPQWTQVLRPDRNRISLIINHDADPLVGNQMAVSVDGGNNLLFIQLPNGPTVLPYRDYGPLIQEGFWFRPTAANSQVTCVEVVKLPR